MSDAFEGAVCAAVLLGVAAGWPRLVDGIVWLLGVL